jgi:S1-C subfamily serine protease
MTQYKNLKATEITQIKLTNALIAVIEYQREQEVKTNISLDIISNHLNSINKKLEIIEEKTEDKTLADTVNRIIKKDKFNKFLFEKKLQQINVFIKEESVDLETNEKSGCIGSGVSIKYKNNYYVLSAAHLVRADNSVLTLMENDQEICELEVVKINVEQDLVIMRPKNRNIKPLYYSELADTEPLTAQEIYIVGNPAGIEDIVSEGRVAFYNESYMVIRDGCYFGNSGGGVYNKQGQVVGIVSAVTEIPNGMGFPGYILDLMVRLNVIKTFLTDVR